MLLKARRKLSTTRKAILINTHKLVRLMFKIRGTQLVLGGVLWGLKHHHLPGGSADYIIVFFAKPWHLTTISFLLYARMPTKFLTLCHELVRGTWAFPRTALGFPAGDGAHVSVVVGAIFSRFSPPPADAALAATVASALTSPL